MMQTAIRRSIPVGIIAAALALAPSLPRAHQGDDDEGRDEGRCGYRNRNFLVSHVSTLPANVGQEVKLFVRERGNSCGPPVLMLGGSTQPAVATFDLPYVAFDEHGRLDNYSWMTHLANAGFDVFVMEIQGYGLSTRPEVMNDPCNAAQAGRNLLNPELTKDCKATPDYGFFLTNNQSEWDQIDSVVNYILAAPHRDRVNLVGWSQGAPRAGGYASEHPEKVERLLLYAPYYVRTDPSSLPVPQPGTPLSINAVSAFFTRWDGQATCPNQFDPGVRVQLTASIIESDPLAATWGAPASGPLWRSPNFSVVYPNYFGWNSAAAAKLHMPILLIRGDNDTQVPLPLVKDLYRDVSSDSKVFVHVACGAHQLVWDRQHTRLLDASVQWLKDGRYNGERNGCFAVDVNGVVTPDATSSLTACGP